MNTLMSEFPGLLEHAEPCCCLIPGKNYFPHTIFLNNLVTCQFLPTSLLQQLPKSERMLPPRHMKPANCNLFNCFSCCAAGQRNSDESPTCPLAHTWTHMWHWSNLSHHSKIGSLGFWPWMAVASSRLELTFFQQQNKAACKCLLYSALYNENKKTFSFI